MTEEDYFATGPAQERPIFAAVMDHVMTLGPVHAEFVSVGVFLKNPRKFAELRPMTRWVAVSFSLRRHARHPRINRKVVEYGDLFWHVANVSRPEEVDRALRDLLTEAYEIG